MMRRRGLATLVMLGAATLTGCAATATIDPDREIVRRLPEMGEIRGVHYFAPAGMRVLASSSTVPSSRDEFLPVEAPVKPVKDRFLARVHETLGLRHLQIIDAPRGARVYPLMAPPIELLKETWSRGLVFDFYTGLWELAPVYRPLPLGPRHYRFVLMVRGRLIRLDDSTILWQQLCLLRGFKPEERTLDEWRANDFAALRAEMQREIELCADDLIAGFLGNRRER